MGGMGEKNKKNHARENGKNTEKISCKEEDKEKIFVQKEGLIVTVI